MANFDANISDVELTNGNGVSFQDEVNCSPPTGINVLVIGTGVGGLTAALECHRKGHAVQVFERSSEASAGGDMFTIGSSALKMLDHYPDMKREYNEVSVHNLWMRFSKWTGESIGPVFPFGAGAPGSEKDKATKPPMETQLRPQFHAMLYHQLQRFGIRVQFDRRVKEYYEDADRGVGGIVTDTGERFEADLVIAADGLNSKSQVLVPRTTGDAKPTGRTIFRGAFPLEIAQADPLVNEVFGLKDGKDPMMQVWLGPDTHSVVLAYLDKHGKNGKLAFGLAFREPEGQPRKESWHDTVSSEEMLRVIERLPGWSEAMKRLITITPPETIVAWPLNPRNPNPVWHSPAARVLQLGDAAHPFLPTSGNGATQAIEDSVTIAECLAQAGKDQVTTAVKVHNLLRADRVSCCQLLGFANAERFQKTDFDAVGKDPSKVQPKLPKWIWSLDPEKYTQDNYVKAAKRLAHGGPAFSNTNIPPGHVPNPWTIDEVEAIQKAGGHVELSGDWS